jgi:hypothetical protein
VITPGCKVKIEESVEHDAKGVLILLHNEAALPDQIFCQSPILLHQQLMYKYPIFRCQVERHSEHIMSAGKVSNLLQVILDRKTVRQHYDR